MHRPPNARATHWMGGPKKEKRAAQDEEETDLDVDLTEFGFDPGYCITERATTRDKNKPELEADLKDYGVVPASEPSSSCRSV